MTTYNTGNAVPSANAKDRYDNSQTFDEVANSLTETTPNRIGRQVLTFAGMETRFTLAQNARASEYAADKLARDTEFAEDQAERVEIFDTFILTSGYQDLGDYDDGPLTITARNQIFMKDGEMWKPAASLTLPYTTVNNWATDAPKFVSVGDAALRQELAQPASVVKVSQSAFIGFDRTISAPDPNPVVESAYDVSLGGEKSNASLKRRFLITGTNTAGAPATGYENYVDGVQDYAFMRNESGHNESLMTNDGRTGIYVSRRKIVQDGQGDLFAFNASVRIRSTKAGATHWLASPAAGVINGTVIGEVDGCYLNPLEFFLTDKPDATAYNVTAVGPVVNMNRNAPSGVALGQVWAGTRFQSVGAAACDVMISGTGKWFSGVDLSMPGLDFGTNKAAFLTKAGDRTYFNARADLLNDGTTFIRSNWRATAGFNDYSFYDPTVLQWKVVVGGVEAIKVSNSQVTLPRVSTTDDIIFATGKGLYSGSSKMIGGRVTGWVRANATPDHVTAFDGATATLPQAWQRIRALEDALHLSGGVNGLLGA